MSWVSAGLWRSLFIFSWARRARTGPCAASQPMRRPPATVFDSDSTWTTWAGASLRMLGTRGPSKRRPAYTASSTTKNERSRASSSRRSRRSAESSVPVGFWHEVCSDDDLDLVAGEDALDAPTSGAVLVDGHGEEPRAGGLERADRAGEGGGLDDGDVAGLDQRAGDEVERLARAGGDDDLVRRAWRSRGGGRARRAPRAARACPRRRLVVRAARPCARRARGARPPRRPRAGRSPGPASRRRAR